MKASKFFYALMAVAMLTLAGCKSSPKDEPTPDPENGTEQGGNEQGGNEQGGNEQGGNEQGGTENPDALNVADLLAMKTNGTLPDKDKGTEKHWVEAYIVGTYNFDNDPKFIIGTDNAVATNLLVADDADCIDTYQVASIKLETNFRSLLNIKDNPGNLKKKLLVYGVVEKYCGIPGVVKIEKAYLDGVELTPVQTGGEAGLFKCYRVSIGDLGVEAAGALKVGDEVTVKCKIVNFKGNTPETKYTNDSSSKTVTEQGVMLSINGAAPADAIDVAKAIEIANSLGADVVSAEDYVITGTVAAIGENGAEQYGNMTFDMK
ncbi:MAG: hypothetical protein IJS73_07240 [Paludibacteraceae bacterium]|nr:hypothetical protein [Paludibacteraceae bacterium]